MSRPTYSRVPQNDSEAENVGSTSYHPLSRRESDSNLVPRTPHSRSGNQTFAQKASSSEPEEDGIDDSYVLTRQSQTAPLLVSSASASFGEDVHLRAHQLPKPRLRSRPSRFTWTLKNTITYMPLILGGIFAVLLCVLIIVSINWPGALQALVVESPAVPEEPHTAPGVDNTASQGNHTGLNDTVTLDGQHGHAAAAPLNYSAYTSFPLTPEEYRTECWKQQANHYHGGYWAKSPGGVVDVTHSTTQGKVCSSTITFMFDGDRGLMADLALIAQLAGLAREQGRTFLIDDRLWTRGNWTDHFMDIRKTQPGPEPDCLAPPPEELVACPRLAKHWVVTPLTAKFHFGHDFSQEFENPYAYSTARLKPIYERAFDSFESFILLSDENAQLVRTARNELRRRIQVNTNSEAVAAYMSVHIRRGDRKAMSWEFTKPGSDGYVPLQNYVDAVQKTWSRLGPPGVPHVYVASDDPVMLDEFAKASPAYVYSLRHWGVDGGRVREASVSSVAEELAELASPSAYVQAEWRERPEAQRIRLTRGMIVEMALLSELWDDDTDEEDDIELIAAACTLTSNVCKMAAVGLGWHRSLESEEKAWVELDNRNNIEPEWEAFETP